MGKHCQLPRIILGLRDLGHIVTDHNPDFIYANDPGGFESAIEVKKKYPDSELILNFLDFPVHCPEFPVLVQKWNHQVKHADFVTAISEYTQKDVFHYLDRKDCKVIYNPVKPVYPINIPVQDRIIDILMVGRLCDPNKRAKLAYEALSLVKRNMTIVTVGSENPGFASKHFYDASDVALNDFYNNSKILLSTSVVEGLNLPVIEGAITGAIPVVCKDMTTAKELLCEEFLAYPSPEGLAAHLERVFANLEFFEKKLEPYSKEYYNKFNQEAVAKNIVKVGMNCYE